MKMITLVLLSLLFPLHLYAGTKDTGAEDTGTEDTKESGKEEEAKDTQSDFEDEKESPSPAEEETGNAEEETGNTEEETENAEEETGNTEEAKRHFEEGKRLFDDNQFAEAADAFRRAYAERSTWKLLHNIAQAEASARRYGPAMEAFEKYMALGGDEISTSRAEMIIAEMKRLRELLGSFALRGEVPDGSIVQVDSLVRGTTPLQGSIRIASGVPHVVEILKDNTVVYERELLVGSGEHMVLDVNPVSDEASMSTLPETTTRESGVSGRRIFIGLGAGFTVALAGAGMAFALVANSKYDDFIALKDRAEGGEIASDDPDLVKAESQTKRYDNLTIGMFVGAGVVAAATISLILVHVVKKNRLKKATSDLSTTRMWSDRFQLVAPGNLIVRF